MLRNTFFALATLLATAASSQAAILIESSPGMDVGNGLMQYTLTAVSDSGQTINTFAQPNVMPNGSGAGLHQVWAPFTTGSPTEGDHTPPLWNNAWRALDSFFFFTPANTLAVGGPYSETNSGAGGASGLPNGAAGPPVTGFGGISATGSRALISGADSSVPFAQFVIKADEQVMLDIGILDNTGARQDFADFLVGAGGPPTNLAPTATDFTIPFAAGYNANEPGEPQSITQQLSASDPNAGDILSFTLGALTYQAAYGAELGIPVPTGPLTAPTLSNTGLFNWVTEGSPRGIYSWSYSVADNGNPSLSDTAVIEVHVAAVPEPSTLALLGLAFVGSLGMIRRRNG